MPSRIPPGGGGGRAGRALGRRGRAFARPLRPCLAAGERLGRPPASQTPPPPRKAGGAPKATARRSKRATRLGKPNGSGRITLARSGSAGTRGILPKGPEKAPGVYAAEPQKAGSRGFPAQHPGRASGAREPCPSRKSGGNAAFRQTEGAAQRGGPQAVEKVACATFSRLS